MIKIYDTKQHAKVDFTMHDHGKVRMYVCGPTVYNYIHIGNARTFMSFDVIRRYFTWRGFEVTYVSNVTDVDDKIIARANEEGRPAAEVAAEYTRAFIEDMHAINVLDPTVRPKATEEIPAMIALVEELVARGHAYEVEGDVYFSVRSLPSYGSLSGRNVDEMESGHRELRAGCAVDDRKRDLLDFAVWKAAKPGEPAWDSPWGQGRPGWHLECSAMSRKYLGLPFDIHGGGADLVFPHHENECAQAEAATGKEFARYWMHGGMLQIDSEKMSKSLGNFKLLRDVLKTCDPYVLRFLMLQTHYRSPLDFSQERLAEAATAFGRIKNALKNAAWARERAGGEEGKLDADAVRKMVRELKFHFVLAMDDDFNTSRGLGVLFDYVAEINALLDGLALSTADAALSLELTDAVAELLDVLGIDVKDALARDEAVRPSDEYPAEIASLAAELAGFSGGDGWACVQALLDAREVARAAKDWARADAVRDRLAALGFVIEDTPQGARVSRA